MSRRRAERLVNLVLCLLATRRFIPAGSLAQIVPGYEHNAADPKAHEAFQRMFERDKTELRHLGVPLQTGTSSIFDTEVGYRIAPDDYALPDIELEPDEAAAVGLAARLWQHAGLAAAASSGLRKFQASGVDVAPDNVLAVEPVLTAEPALDPLLAAVRERRSVRFGYRRRHEDEPTQRTIQPWGVVAARGRWYVVGYDTAREAPRSFRLSRIVGEVAAVGSTDAFEPPADLDLLGIVAIERPQRRSQARLRVRAGAGAGLRRWADAVMPGPPGSDGAPGYDHASGYDHVPGYDIVTVSYAYPEWLAGKVAALGAAVVVEDPPELRDAVLVRLKSLAEYGA